MRVIAYNAMTGRAPHDAGMAVADLLGIQRPHMLGAFEVRAYARVFDAIARELDYHCFQLPPQPLTDRQRERHVQEERANVAVFVRRDVPVLDVAPWVMDQAWIGPKAGLPHLPRVYLRVKVEHEGNRWRTAFAHWPTPIGNRAAMDETYRRSEAFLRAATHAGKPAFIAGDLNQSARALDARLPRVIEGKHVDNLAHNRIVKGSSFVLAKDGSDHHAIGYDLAARR